MVVWRPRSSCARICGGGLALAAQQRVDQRRLAHARRADQRARAAAAELRGERVDAVAALGAGRHAPGTPGATARRTASVRLGVGHEVGLVEHEHRRAAAGGGHGDEALQAARVEVAVGGGDDEGDVDVGGQVLAGARQHAAARQPRADRAAGVDDDPVADRRALARAPGDDGERLALGAGDDEVAAMDGDHARGRAAVGVGCCEGRGERLAPAEVFEVQGALQAR